MLDKPSEERYKAVQLPRASAFYKLDVVLIQC